MTRMERRRRRQRQIRRRVALTVMTVTIAAVGIAFVMAENTATVSAIGKNEAAPSTQMEAVAYEPVELVYKAEKPAVTANVMPEAEEVVEEPDESAKIEEALLEQGYLHEEIPLDYDLQCHLIAVCEEYEVPQSIALGVIQAESSFTADASNGTCFGYMQINKINAEWLREDIGVTDLTDPYQNIRSGVYILSDLYGKYGDWHKALICYNYGEGGAQEYVFSKGYTTTSYSRTVMSYADSWAEVIGS